MQRRKRITFGGIVKVRSFGTGLVIWAGKEPVTVWFRARVW